MFTIFGKEECPFCVKAKELLVDRGFEFKYFLLGKDIDRDSVEKTIGRPFKTVPQIMFDNNYIGGYSDLAAGI